MKEKEPDYSLILWVILIAIIVLLFGGFMGWWFN